jgi:tetratricopeptide (TPR) repeat protein
MLTLMDRLATALLDPATARELAERAGVNTVVLPRFDVVGNGFLVAARVEEVETGHLLAEASHHAADADAVVATVDAVSQELRRDLGETRGALANTDPLPKVLTPSLEALRKYREATALHQNFQPGLAIPIYREALALDPEFSQAYSAIAGAYHNFGDPGAELENTRRALENPERLRDQSRRYLEARLRYESDFALWDESLFRASIVPNNNAIVLVDFQHFDSAFTLEKSDIRERVRRHRRFDPDRPLNTGQMPPLRNVTKLAITTGRLDEFEAFMDSLRIDLAEFSSLNLALGDYDWSRADSIRLSVPTVSWESHVSKRIAIAALDVVRGRVQEGYDDYASIHSPRVTSERLRLLLAVVFGLEGTDLPLSLQGRGRTAVDRYVSHGVRAAILGDTLEAKRVAVRMAAARDSATSGMFENAFHPMFSLLDAGIAGQRGDWDEVTRLLEPSTDRLDETGYGYSTDRFLVRWVLAEAYVHLGKRDLAINQLDALLRERSHEPFNILVYAPTHFKLSQLHTGLGNTEKASEHFAAFLDAFTDPDPEFEWMVEEVRVELARLEG